MWKLQVKRYAKEAPSYQKKIRILSNPSSKDVSKVDTEETLYKNSELCMVQSMKRVPFVHGFDGRYSYSEHKKEQKQYHHA